MSFFNDVTVNETAIQKRKKYITIPDFIKNNQGVRKMQ